jgi:hypothetical protein
MSRGARSGAPLGGRARGAALAIVLALFAPGPARAAEQAGPPTELSLGLLAGSTLLDPHLGDYQWDTRPRPDFGALAMLSRGRVRLGLRAWRSATEQRLQLPGGEVAPSVAATSLELLAGARIASFAGAGISAGVSAGRLRLTWQPDHVTVDTGAGLSEVTFVPIDEWTLGAGLALERPLARHWAASASLDRRFFRLDTAHRSGAGVIDARETFGDWSLRLGLSRVFHLGSREALP